MKFSKFKKLFKSIVVAAKLHVVVEKGLMKKKMFKNRGKFVWFLTSPVVDLVHSDF